MWTDDAFKRWWHRMGQIFGRQWYEQHGPEANDAWKQSLREMSLPRAAAVLEHYRKSGDSFPPNLSQVVSVARTVRTETPTALPAPKQSEQTPRIVQRAVAKMRASSQEVKRSVLRPGESSGAYLAAKMRAADPVKFEAARLYANGWTGGMERSYRARCASVGFTLPDRADADRLIAALEALEQPKEETCVSPSSA